jgi:argininosuccinate lyase
MNDPSPLPSYVRSPQAGFLASLAVDRSLARYDLAGSVAHADMLGHVGLLTASEVATLHDGLRTIGREIAKGSFPWRDELEDVHTNIEVRLTALVGPVGGKLHTARSRNDQVALDERLYLRAAVDRVARVLVRLEGLLIAKASAHATVPMPGYTHLQRAQPVTVGHYLLAHFWRFDRDLDRLLATVQRADVSPLGAGALAGSTLPIDPTFTAKRLGFDRSFENSMDAVSDRDPFAELLFDLALLAVHSSALGEEIVLFASKEFGFLERSPALGSGSSLMPQKRNPDAAELVRGKTGRTIGDLVALLTTLKGLPLAYDRDLQEDKAPVLDAVETVLEVLEALATAVDGLVFDPARLRSASEDPELFATDIAERLVAQGVPFRTAHESVGKLYAAASGPVDAPAVQAGLPTLTPSLSGLLDPVAGLERRTSPGGPSPGEVARQLAAARARLTTRVASLSSLDRKVALIEELLEEERK